MKEEISDVIRAEIRNLNIEEKVKAQVQACFEQNRAMQAHQMPVDLGEVQQLNPLENRLKIRKDVMHAQQCSECGIDRIIGTRFTCLACVDFHL